MRVFLSHSNKDKKFVRRLHESLIWNGIDTFFDEKDIKAGDNIPIKIERGIAEAAHVIYVLSSNSINSAWVNEELSMAKVRAKIESGFKVIPVLIGDLELPVGIAHIKYANFVGWEQGERYYEGLDELFDAIGAKKKIAELNATSFTLQNLLLLLNLERASWRYGTFIDGMVDGFFDGMPSGGLLPIADMAHHRRDLLGLLTYLNDLDEILQKVPSDSFVELRSLISECMNYPVTPLAYLLIVDQNPAMADELYKERNLYYKLASLLTAMIQDATMQIITSIDFSKNEQLNKLK